MQRLPLHALRTASMVPVISPLPTTVALIGDALAHRERPRSRDLLRRLRTRDVAALLPLRTVERPDGAGGRPNEVVPTDAGASFTDALDAVAALAPHELAARIDTAQRAGHPIGPWRAVARDPARWLRAYVDALRRAWTGIEPLWTRSADLLDRDAERVGVALARGAGAELIVERYPYAAIADDALLLPSHSGRSGHLAVGTSLHLQPLLAPVSASGWTDDYGDTCLAVRYPVPHAWRAFVDDPPPSASLEALLGPQRARILLRLDAPVTAGQLSEMLHAVPSMATHHLRVLEAAGLIKRTREGRQVWVRRTARGTELVALYAR